MTVTETPDGVEQSQQEDQNYEAALLVDVASLLPLQALRALRILAEQMLKLIPPRDLDEVLANAPSEELDEQTTREVLEAEAEDAAHPEARVTLEDLKKELGLC